MSESVKAIVRCRPLNEREIDTNVDIVISVDPLERQITLSHSNNAQRSFTFDHVFATDATNEEIYNEAVSPLVQSVLLGYNGCVFAFGQTSCGKTFSMQGVQKPASQRGVMPRAFQQIFECIQTTDVTYYLVRASYLEIYNEEIRDLLQKQNHHKLEVKEHPEKGVYVKDLTNIEVTCIEDMEEVLEIGSWNRVLGSTAQNPDSSRSHCIFTVEFEISFFSDQDQQEHFRSGRLNLVDLAGSERQRHSKSEGDRFREATKINLSLSALGNVISALVNEKSKHIPYRASKLTRLLQDSLGGNSRTLMIACVSPGANNYGETLSTLRYANRAKNIKNRPRINEDPKDTMIKQYQKEIKVLRHLLSNQIKISGETPLLPPPISFEIIEDKKPNRTAVVITKQERLAYEQQISGLQHKFDYEHTSREKFETSLKSTKADFENYRLKNEYKIHKLKIEYQLKIKKLEKLLQLTKDDASDESAYVSNDSDETENICPYFSYKKDKSTLLSPVTENSHLWSYQWLKCYCDSNGKTMSKNVFLTSQSNNQFYCICSEQIKKNLTNEKESQTCQICIRRLKLSNIDFNNIDYNNIDFSDSVSLVTSQPSSIDEDFHRKELEQKPRLRNGICCFIPGISFFGEAN
ncbi:kinesin-like protein KIF17 [Hydra vulgaris]|uniref:Kinesin-like protein n=1 Tax=Hydra vulgaris TaxID=6087 RepID=A0ABM4BXF1_HYDVU